LAATAGVLALHGLEVRRATATEGRAGTAVERFDVEPAHGRWPDWERVEADISAALDGSLLLEARLDKQSEANERGRRRTSARRAETRVIVDNDASELATVIEVRVADSHGLLHRIARTLAGLQLDVSSALVATLGHEVVDTFYVRDMAASPPGKLVDGARLDEVRRALEEALGGAARP
ncbi:MAG TPA: hypothetical protein VGS21_09075, partial [Acidimicrobiales bacterium]|nr:hypothetical protein [Acidimicrobiales bacterium]